MFTLRKYLGVEAVLFILLGAGAGFVVLAVHNSQSNYQANAQSIQQNIMKQLPSAPNTVANPTQTPAPITSPIPTAKPDETKQTPTVTLSPAISTTTSQISSDGTRKVIVATTQNKDGNQTYAVSIDNGPVIFSKTLTSGSSIKIPFNTWSPDNNYFFIEEDNGSQQQIMVFNGNGQTFQNSQPYLDLTGTFAQDYPNAIFDQASGWASDNLIIILTKNADGSEGTSFWYGVPDGSVTPLATQF